MVKNAVFYTPKLVNPVDSGPTLSVEAIRSHEIEVYWGPGQGPSNIYNPPNDWPTAGNMLRIPHVLRFIWEITLMDSTGQVAYGPAGDYTYATNFIDSFDTADVSTNPGIFSAIGHSEGIFNPDGPVYAQAFTTDSNGFEDLSPAYGSLTLTGHSVYHVLAIVTEPISLNAWNSPSGVAVGEAIYGLEGGATNSPASPAPVFQPFAAPPYTTTFNGPHGVGVVMLPNKGYTIDGIEYSPPQLKYPPDNLTIPYGYHIQNIVDLQGQEDRIRNFIIGMDTDFDTSSYPYFDHYHLPGEHTGISQFWDYTYVFPGAQNWFPTNVVTMWYLRKPHLNITSDQISNIIASFSNFDQCVNIIYIDDQYMLDSHLPPSTVDNFINEINTAISILSAQQFIFGGTSGGTFSFSGTQDMQLEARAVATTFFGSNLPTSIDPPRPPKVIGNPDAV